MLAKTLLILLGLGVYGPAWADSTEAIPFSQSSLAGSSVVLSEATRPDPRPRRPLPRRGSYYDWGQGRDGFGYCYQWASNGTVLNGGQAQANFLCEEENPSYHYWGQGRDGFGYCYQYTPYGIAMNGGLAQNNYLCETDNPSYYSWSRGRNGHTYCYQFTSNGLLMNGGQAQPNHLCQ